MNTSIGKSIKCGTSHYINLSYCMFTASLLVCVLSVLFNTLIIYVIVKERKTKFKNIFHKLVLNISIADLSTGLVACPASMSFHLKNSVGARITVLDTYFLHLSVFYADAVALVTMTLLCTDRIIALWKPLKYHNGVKHRTENIIVVTTWFYSACFVAPYFILDYVKELAIYITLNVSIVIISLIVTTIVYQEKLRHRVHERQKKETKLMETTNVVLSSPDFTQRSIQASVDLTSTVEIARLTPTEEVNRRHSSKSLLDIPSSISASQCLYLKQNGTNKISNSLCQIPNLSLKIPVSLYKIPSSPHRIPGLPRQTPSSPHCLLRFCVDQDVNSKIAHLDELIKATSRTSRSASCISIFSFTNNDSNSKHDIIQSSRKQHKATKTFLNMSLIFIITYLPTCCMMIYLNTCLECGCLTIHAMRDLSTLSIILSSLFRPITFICSLRHLRSRFKKIVNRVCCCFKTKA